MRSALCAHWTKSAASPELRRIGRDTSTLRIPVSSTRFIWLAPGGFLQPLRFHIFNSTLSLWSGVHRTHLRLLQSQGRARCFLICPRAQSIGYLLLPADGVILHASRCPAQGCV